VYTQLPVYRCCLIATICTYLWALCLLVWKKSRINYQYMFDFDPKSILSPV